MVCEANSILHLWFYLLLLNLFLPVTRININMKHIRDVSTLTPTLLHYPITRYNWIKYIIRKSKSYQHIKKKNLINT